MMKKNMYTAYLNSNYTVNYSWFLLLSVYSANNLSAMDLENTGIETPAVTTSTTAGRAVSPLAATMAGIIERESQAAQNTGLAHRSPSPQNSTALRTTTPIAIKVTAVSTDSGVDIASSRAVSPVILSTESSTALAPESVTEYSVDRAPSPRTVIRNLETELTRVRAEAQRAQAELLIKASDLVAMMQARDNALAVAYQKQREVAQMALRMRDLDSLATDGRACRDGRCFGAVGYNQLKTSVDKLGLKIHVDCHRVDSDENSGSEDEKSGLASQLVSAAGGSAGGRAMLPPLAPNVPVVPAEAPSLASATPVASRPVPVAGTFLVGAMLARLASARRAAK